MLPTVKLTHGIDVNGRRELALADAGQAEACHILLVQQCWLHQDLLVVADVPEGTVRAMGRFWVHQPDHCVHKE